MNRRQLLASLVGFPVIGSLFVGKIPVEDVDRWSLDQPLDRKLVESLREKSERMVGGGVIRLDGDSSWTCSSDVCIPWSTPVNYKDRGCFPAAQRVTLEWRKQGEGAEWKHKVVVLSYQPDFPRIADGMCWVFSAKDSLGRPHQFTCTSMEVVPLTVLMNGFSPRDKNGNRDMIQVYMPPEPRRCN